MNSRPNHAPAIKQALSDPKRLLEALGILGEGCNRQRQTNGFLVRCPVHGDRTPSCSVQRIDGVVLWKCHGCQATGDALSLVAAVRGLSMRGAGFRDVLLEAARIAGLWGVVDEIEGRAKSDDSPPLAATAPPQRQEAVMAPRTYPDDADAFWGALSAAGTVELAAEYLRGRGIDPDAVDAKDLARAIPEHGALPAWAVCRGGTWREANYRLIVAMFDASGALRGVRAWRIADGDGPKRLPPYGHKASELVMADAFGLAWLRGQREPKRIVITEGEPDWLTWSTRLNDPSTATIGIVSGSWHRALAHRVPIGCRVDVRTHLDQAGDRYAAEIETSLRRRTPAIYRVSEAA